MLTGMSSLFQARRRIGPVAAILAVLTIVSPVIAHAELVRAIPGDGETLTGPVSVISGRYSADLIGNSRLEVSDATGAVVATGGIDANDAGRMVVRADPPLTEGTYTVRSTAITDDGHGPERVTWTFTVTPGSTPAPTASPTPSGTPGSSPSADPPSPTPSSVSSASPSTSPAPTAPTSSGGDVLLPIIAALAIVAIGAGVLLSRGRARR